MILIQRFSTVVSGFQRIPSKSSQSTKMRIIERIATALNQLTEYDQVELLKRKVIEKDELFTTSKAKLMEFQYEHAQNVERRFNCQADMNALLQSKPTWTTERLAKFTKLCEDEHVLSREEEASKLKAVQQEKLVDTYFNDYMKSIQLRYQTEQEWSEKLRALSTYVSLSLILLNTSLFFLSVLIIEPRKRKQIVEALEDQFKKDNEKLVNSINQILSTQQELGLKISESTFNNSNDQPDVDSDQKKNTHEKYFLPVIASASTVVITLIAVLMLR